MYHRYYRHVPVIMVQNSAVIPIGNNSTRCSSLLPSTIMHGSQAFLLRGFSNDHVSWESTNAVHDLRNAILSSFKQMLLTFIFSLGFSIAIITTLCVCVCTNVIIYATSCCCQYHVYISVLVHWTTA